MRRAHFGTVGANAGRPEATGVDERLNLPIDKVAYLVTDHDAGSAERPRIASTLAATEVDGRAVRWEFALALACSVRLPPTIRVNSKLILL